MKMSRSLIDNFWASFGKATQRNIAWEDLMGEADYTGERYLNK